MGRASAYVASRHAIRSGYRTHRAQVVLASVFSQRFENLPNLEDERARGTRRGSRPGRVQNLLRVIPADGFLLVIDLLLLNADPL